MRAVWVEAILLRDDLSQLVAQLLPLTIHLGEGTLSLSDPRDVSLLADDGLRVSCKAHIHWPVLGTEIPVALNELTVVLRPEIIKQGNADAVLAFKLRIEHADLAAVPAFIDNGLTALANAELASKHTEMSWDFVRTLSHAFPMPASLEPLETLDLSVSDARLKVSEAAMGLAILFKFAVVRGERGAGSRDPKSAVAPTREVESVRRPESKDATGLFRQRGTAAVGGALGALAVVGVYALLRRSK